MRHIAIFAVMLAALLALATPTRAGVVEDCVQSHDRDVQIGGCTAAIRSGQWQGKELAWAYNHRGAAYRRDIDDAVQAIEDFDQALRLDPSYALAYYNRGLAYKNLGEYRRAIEDFDQLLRLYPDDAYAYYDRGLAYDLLGDHARAIEDYDQTLRLDPDDSNAYTEAGQSGELNSRSPSFCPAFFPILGSSNVINVLGG